ncbi:MAG TPA: hypothetical protein VLK34_09140 [Nocardioidaceae bacterium]|nr:hypothetical protein [Nocardioidaceae bacterium]
MKGDGAFDPTEQRSEGAVRRRSRLRIAGAALAVAVVACGIAIGVGLSSGDSGNRSQAISLQPAPDDGWRWDFYRDVRIEVPDSWDYASEPRSDWCVDNGKWLPDEPYIDLTAGEFVFGIGCPSTNGKPGMSDEPPTERWVPHVRLTALGAPDTASVSRLNGWWIVKQPVGHVLVKAVGENRAEVDRILSSATVVDDDSSGCAPHSPLQDSAFPSPDPAFDVAELTSVDSITVCSYELTPSEPGLLGVYELTGDDAMTELHALQAAPIGGGPDRPNDCGPDDPGDDALQLRLASGAEVDTMYVFYSSCHDNGFDDGTNVRELTKDACVPLVHAPVTLTTGASASFERCFSRSSDG